MNYRLGLDIGITSIGWCVIRNDESGAPTRIEDLGVRCFDAAENPKDGSALCLNRRTARSARRRIRRRAHRMERLKFLFEREGFISINETEALLSKPADTYALRYEALSRALTRDEFVRVLYHIAKHRGFKSNRRSEREDKEAGKVLTAAEENQNLMAQKKYRTVGEMLWLDDKFKSTIGNGETVVSPRNKKDDYKNTVLRDLLSQELKIIFELQRSFGNKFASEHFEEKYMAIFSSQRSFDEGPGNTPDGRPSPYGGNMVERMIGTFRYKSEKPEPRACKATYSFEIFMLLQKVNNLRVYRNGKVRSLTPEECQTVINAALATENLKYNTIRNKLKLPEDALFDNLSYRGNEIKETETKTSFVKLPFIGKIRTLLGEDWVKNENAGLLDSIGTVLSYYKNDDRRISELSALGLDQTTVELLLPLNFSKAGHLSLTAIRKINPYLREGFVYNEACAKAGYDFQMSNTEAKKELLDPKVLEELTNPVVKRAISQTIKVMNAVIRKYGSPQIVCVELAREMAKDFVERKKLEAENEKNQAKNEGYKKLISEYKTNPTGFDIVKYKLWLEQGEHCAYSLRKITLKDLFSDGVVDVDHIIPYSVSFDDSYNNKVLVFASENRQKGNRLPYEYFGADSKRWDEFRIFCENRINNYKKRQKLFKKTLTEEDLKGFKERSLTDTKYISRFMYNLIRNELELAPLTGEGKKQVYAVNGAVTSYLRTRWGLKKIREDGDKHHAMDAAVVACCTDGMIRKISYHVQGRETKFSGNKLFVDRFTGETFSRADYDEQYGANFPLPYTDFSDELQIRLAEDPMNYREPLIKMGYDPNEPVEAVFVSRMPKHSVTGAAHAETVRSPRHLKDGVTLIKKSLTELKLKDGEIEGYYKPESDRTLYNALKRQLAENGGNAQKAFAEPFFKPKADGTPGPVVRSVKLTEKQTSGVFVHEKKGIADNANGGMVRIDVYRENGKYYYVPIYVADTLLPELPNRAATGGKPKSGWRVMKPENFLFSLFPRDLLHVRSKRGVKLYNSEGRAVVANEIFLYFYGADISTASISGVNHDKSLSFRSLGIQGLDSIEKYQVGVLGDRNAVKKEPLKSFHLKKRGK